MKPIKFLLIALSALAFVGCRSTQTLSCEMFTEEAYAPREAAGFAIRTAPESQSTLISIRNPWQGAQNITQHLLLLRGEEQAPTGFEGQVVQAPVRRVVCMSSSHIAMFDAVGEVKRVSGVSGIDYISNEYIRAHKLCGVVRDVGYDTNIDFELLTAMRPDLVLLYGVTGENTIVTGKLRELNIPYIYIGDYMEQSPLGKAEWLVLAAELCDCRQRGEELFDSICSRYEALRARAAHYTERPSVMLNTPYRDTWFMPSSRSFVIRLIEDAGGTYIYTKNDSDTSVAVDLEEAYQLASRADFWIQVGGCNTLAELTAQNPKFADVPAVRNRRVWNNNRRQTVFGGSDFWESGVVRPDRVLEDLIAVLHGDADSAATYYYKRLE